MTILSIYTDTTGQIGVLPRRVKIISTDSLATVITAGYLNNTNLFGYTINPTDVIDMIYLYSSATGLGTYDVFIPTFSNGIITLEAWISPAEVTLPVVTNHIALFDGTTGKIKQGAAGVTALNNGPIQAGASGTAGALISYPATEAKGSLRVVGVANTGDTVSTISNAAMGQASVISIPDPGASTANVLLDDGAANIVTDYQEFVGIENILFHTTGTWATQRNGVADYVVTKAQAAQTTVTGIDILPQIRLAASKGFRLASIDVIYGIATLALVTHTATLSKVNFANNAAITVTSVPLTGSLATATQANLYVTNLTVTTPAFDNTTVSKYVFELTTNAGATTDYALYGLNLKFSKTIS